MTQPVLALAIDLAPGMSPSEAAMFWILGPLAVISASALIFAKRAVYAAMAVVITMVCLAFLYVSLQAPFLGVVQVVVYTGAIMMLFVFVLMLVGVDVSDSLTETIRGQRTAAVILGIGLAVVGGGVALRATLSDPVGLDTANGGNNPGKVAQAVFTDYPFTLELVGTLLIIAALGAVIMTHRARLHPRRGQRELAIERIRRGVAVAPLPAPGVYSRSNAADVPALDASGRPIETSVPQALRLRGQVRRAEQVALTPIEPSPETAALEPAAEPAAAAPETPEPAPGPEAAQPEAVQPETADPAAPEPDAPEPDAGEEADRS
ncbi:MAG: NADH-quinone oxidoreductase subunit J [Bifidobacteriaceae bacterium]|jgi:NADH-quinone oxidoreductase subunit J|nr:NADH-quinone oxidoreductase subunit J [Bifidobacteriaceae bacterium]